MDGIFNASDILKIAETIEENGANFYRDAANFFPNDDISRIFTDLAEWELQHKKIFSRMREKIAQEHPKLGPGTDEYKSVAALSTFSLWSTPYAKFIGLETKDEVIRQAIQKEKDTIVFYVGLKDFVSEQVDKEAINDIIGEEMGHITFLTDALGK